MASSTHLDGPTESLGSFAVWIASSPALGCMSGPLGGDCAWQDVYGAGAPATLSG